MLTYVIKDNTIFCRDEDVVVSVTYDHFTGFTGYVKYLKEDKLEVFEVPYINDYSETIKARIRVCVKRLFRAVNGIKKQA